MTAANAWLKIAVYRSTHILKCYWDIGKSKALIILQEAALNKAEVVLAALKILNEHGTVVRGTYEYHALYEQIELLIDQLGQEKALGQVRKAKAILLEQVLKERNLKPVELK